MTFFRPLLPAVAAMLIAGPAAAEEPTAMVEDISSDRDDVQIMDFLAPGQTIALKADEVLVVGYFASCAEETITGGTVTVGQFNSTVDGGAMDTVYLDCDSQVAALSDAQRQEAGVTVFRPGDPCTALVPDIVVYDPSPLVRFGDGAAAAVSFVDACEASSDDWPSVPASGRVADFRDAGISLKLGGTYLLRADGRTMTVLVSKLAQPGSAAMSRVVPF